MVFHLNLRDKSLKVSKTLHYILADLNTGEVWLILILTLLDSFSILWRSLQASQLNLVLLLLSCFTALEVL